LMSAEVNVVSTNWVDRWITNMIQVQVPRNRFVDLYHTNWVTQLRTNSMDVYATNWSMCKVTNVIEVGAIWTNSVTAYHTNWTTKTVTAHVALNAVRTNFVERYQTNWSVLNLTNWETVVLFKTNWIIQRVTNVVQLDLPKRVAVTAPAAAATVTPQESAAEFASTTSADWAGALAIEAARTSRVFAGDLVEIQLRIRRAGNSGALPHVQRWQVEREDGAILASGQDQVFKRQLPVGRYKVEVKLKGEGDEASMSLRASLSITTGEAIIQPRRLAKK
jgi:hypothetical protein